MQLPIGSLIHYAWIGLAALWIGAAAFTRTTVRSQSTASRLVQFVFTLPGCLLLAGGWFNSGWLGMPFAPYSSALAGSGLVLTLAGILFAIWARVQLGANWSGRVTVKQGHELITSGPYAIVRHPIYTGVLIAATGTTLAIDRWHCTLGIILLLIGFLIKMPQEEQLMMQTFPEEYPRYKQRTKALIPGIM